MTTAGRNPARNDVALDLASASGAAPSSSYVAMTEQADVVINASGFENPALAAASAAPFIDIGASAPYFAQIATAHPRAGALLSVGLAPGLSSILASTLSSAPHDEIDVAIVLGVGEKHGDAAIAWTAGLLGKRFESPADGRTVLNFSEGRRFDVPGFGRAVLVRTDFPDGAASGAGPVHARVRSYFATTSTFATLALRAVTHAPSAGRGVTALHLPGSDAWFVVARNRRTGEQLAAQGNNQSLATAAVTALAAEATLKHSWSGVQHLPQLLSLDELRHGLRQFARPTGVAGL